MWSSVASRAIDAVDLEIRHPNGDTIATRVLEMNAQVGPVYRSLAVADQARARQALIEGFQEFRQSDESDVLPSQM